MVILAWLSNRDPIAVRAPYGGGNESRRISHDDQCERLLRALVVNPAASWDWWRDGEHRRQGRNSCIHWSGFIRQNSEAHSEPGPTTHLVYRQLHHPQLNDKRHKREERYD